VSSGLVLPNGEGGTEAPRKIVIVSDAWYPQVNGVVRTLQTVAKQLIRLGHKVTMLTPDQFRGLPCPTYPEIRLALNAWPSAGRMLTYWRPDSIFIATEGPLGLAARQLSAPEG